jgi:hypothetical protein
MTTKLLMHTATALVLLGTGALSIAPAQAHGRFWGGYGYGPRHFYAGVPPMHYGAQPYGYGYGYGHGYPPPYAYAYPYGWAYGASGCGRYNRHCPW